MAELWFHIKSSTLLAGTTVISKTFSHSEASSKIGSSLSAMKITTTLGSGVCNQYSPTSSIPSIRPWVGAFPSCGPCILRARYVSKATEVPSFSLNKAANNILALIPPYSLQSKDILNYFAVCGQRDCTKEDLRPVTGPLENLSVHSRTKRSGIYIAIPIVYRTAPMASTKTAAEILEAVVEDGRQELARGSTGLAFSGFVAGLNISFSAIALAVVGALTGGIGLAAIAAYPVGFILVVLGQAELFTEHTVTPVTVVLTDRRQIWNTLRLWVVIFVFNILGVIAFASAVVYGNILSPTASDLLLSDVSHQMENGFLAMAIRGVFGGWLVALVAWMVAAARDTISQTFFTWLLVALIPATGLAHCVAGSAEHLISVFSNETSWGEYLGRFLLPATLGNAVGGIILVTLLNYGQVVASRVKYR